MLDESVKVDEELDLLLDLGLKLGLEGFQLIQGRSDPLRDTDINEIV